MKDFVYYFNLEQAGESIRVDTVGFPPGVDYSYLARVVAQKAKEYHDYDALECHWSEKTFDRFMIVKPSELENYDWDIVDCGVFSAVKIGSPIDTLTQAVHA